MRAGSFLPWRWSWRLACLGWLALCPGLVWAGDTVRNRLSKDDSFQLYAVVFGITLSDSGKLLHFRVVRVTDPQDEEPQPKKIDVPAVFIQRAERVAKASDFRPKVSGGLPEEFYTYYYYAPSHPHVVINDLDSTIEEIEKKQELVGKEETTQTQGGSGG